MIELVSVEVENFRSFSTAQFSPLGMGQGMTAVNGANGSGKSSIATHAVLWALYGVTPDGVPVRALRRQDSEGDVRASVTFRHDGQVVCVTRALRGKKDTTTAAISVDGVEQTSVSARTATAWVTNRLGVDAEAFITAFVVRQKEVDGLVRARPAERRALIERLAGIDRMSQALARAREQARTQSQFASSLGGGADPDEAAKAAEEAARLAADAADAVRAASDRAVKAQESAQLARVAYQEADASFRKVVTAEHAVDLARQACETASAEFNRVSAAAQGADLLPDMQAAVAQALDERREAEQAVRTVEFAKTRAEQANSRVVEAQEAVDTASAKARTAVQKADEADEAVTAVGYQPTMEDDLARVSREASAALAAVGAAEGEMARLTRAIDALQAAVDAACCPTCAQALADPASLIESMKADRETVAAQVESRKAEAALLASHTDDLSAKIREYGVRVQAAERAHQVAQEAEALVLQAAQTLSRLEDIADTEAEAWMSAKNTAAAAEQALPDLIAAEQAASTALRKAEAAAEAETVLPEVTSRFEKATAALSAALADLAAAQENVAGVDLIVLEESASKAAADAQTASNAAADARQDAALAAREAQIARHAADQAAEQALKRKEALAAAETAHAVSAALEEFRRDRIARLAPELSEVASDIVSTMTEGRYSTVDLDEDFTPILTEAATGLERPVSWLSGGEESAVALALRIAIGEVVAGQRGGLLILDEALTAQDKSRRAAVMSAIRTLPRQVITINHVSEATDMVDLVAHVVPDGDGAFTIEHAASGSDAEADLDDGLLDS